ncbi:nucleoporin subcomplex protein binding to Pom34-domain-containing protein [Xylariaceae sp. FL1019]|nr:nucleoporin subcomplex protein binding to Pom34-domain-containing protein [Xylariaceae sp. FL1019]
MAEPLSDHIYLPPLEPCLKGDTVILYVDYLLQTLRDTCSEISGTLTHSFLRSWNLVAAALTDPTGHRQSSQAIVDFLTDPLVQSFFTNPGSPFEPSTNRSSHRAAFEKKTAAIHVTPNPNGKYDINLVKEDVLWLSTNVRINELAALRVVIVEHQSRPASQLLGPISTQDVANLRAAAGVASTQSSNVLPGLNLIAARDATEIQADFDKLESRRQRIFHTYLSERRHYAATHDYIFTLMLHQRLHMSPATQASALIRTSLLQAYGISPKQPQAPLTDIPTKTSQALITQYISLLPGLVQNVYTSVESVVEDKSLATPENEDLWCQTSLAEILHRMTIVFQLLDRSSHSFVSETTAKQWFTLFHDDPTLLNRLQTELADPLQCLVCIISLKMLNLPRMMAFFEGEIDLDTDNEFLANSSTLELVHDTLETAVDQGAIHMAPVLFAWIPIVHAMFLSYQDRAEKRDTIQNQKAVENYDSNTQMVPTGRRRNSAGSITTIDKRRYDDFLINKNLDRDSERVQKLAGALIEQIRVYDVIAALPSCLGPTHRSFFSPLVGSRMRIALLDLLKATHPFVGYKSDPVTALLSVLSGGHTYWDVQGPSKAQPDDILTYALNDAFVVEAYIQEALDRFPYEFTPLMTLCRILVGSSDGDGHERVLNLLQKTPTLTFTLPEHFTDYYLANEDENVNAFQFAVDFPLFAPRTSRSRITAQEEPFIIPAGTYGRFVVDEGKIVRVEYEHSLLALLGKRLEANGSKKYDMPLDIMTTDEVAESISLLATLVRAEALRDSDSGAKANGSTEAGRAIVQEASRVLPRNKDIISVVCDTLDVLLDSDADSSVLQVLNACIQFLHAILQVCPGRVWAYMARCALLEGRSQGGRLARLVGTLDLSEAQFDLLISSIRLFSSLVDSAVSGSVQRRTVVKTNPRQPVENVWIGVSDKVITQITLAISQAAVDYLESSSTWRFPTDVERMILVRDIVPMLDNIIYYSFGMDDIAAKTALMSVLQPAAQFVIDSFLAPSAGSLRLLPLLATLVKATQENCSTIYATRTTIFCDQTLAVLTFATHLVRITNYSDRPSSTVEQQLFKVIPFIARLCARHDAFKGPTIELLESLVISAGKTIGEPPSLLGYLGPHTSRSFLQLVSMLDRPFNQADQANIIWRFFSTIVRNRQQWMANCLLTGKTPRDARNGNGNASETSSSSILSSALERLASISSLDGPEALSILDFITSAQNYWPWTIFALQKNATFLTEIRKFIRSVKPSSLVSKTDALRACVEARIAAYIAEIFAMQLFHLRQIDQASSFAKELTQDLDYYLRDGVGVSGYNRGLHVNFTRNFKQQYPSCSLEHFKRTLLEPKRLGEEFYYALGFADRILRFDSSWVGPKNNGFRSEMQKANTNLSLVDAQVSLYHAWEFLLLELSTCLPDNDTLRKQSLQVAQQCLEANQEMEMQRHDQVVFVRLAESRVNLSLMLVQRVANSAPSPGDVAQLLAALWGTVSRYQDPYAPQNISIYRTLLRLLYVTLRALIRSYSHVDFGASVRDSLGNSLSAATISQSILGILDAVVAKGFRIVVSLVHDSETSVSNTDIVIINAILQACLSIPGIDQSQTQILNILATHDTVQAAVSLFSWADKLAVDGDPIYGELSLLFLLELSALPLIAEQLACDGLLNQITSASLAGHLRRPNVSPFADSVGPQRCYGIWAKGIVPILLNVLSALGATIAPEVAYVLNQFPHLMQSSIERLEVPRDTQSRSRLDRAFVTPLSVSEIHSLALITRVLSAFRTNNARDIPAVEWDSTTLLENVDWWLDHRKVLRDRLVTLGPREAEWKTMPASDIEKKNGSQSKLEAKVVDQLEAVRIALSEQLE